MRFILVTLLLLGSVGFAGAQSATPSVVPLQLPEGSTSGEFEGRIEEGQTIPLEWAARSSVAAFPMPAGCKLKITLTPNDGKLVNLYALRQGAQETAAPPNITSAISAEANYPLYVPTGSGTTVRNRDDGVRTIEFISIDRPYSILVGVAGAEGITQGDYRLRFDVESR